MNTTNRSFKTLEKKVHEQLWTSIFLLTGFHPTTKEFDEVFKRDMFVKSNKAAFHQVIFYLLNILNPALTKEKLTWPLYDIPSETKFRSQVLAYISELNSLYVDADIPRIQASHLVVPAGFHFVKFMLKLSQLVTVEHLKQSEKMILGPIKPDKDVEVTKLILDGVKSNTRTVEREIEKEIGTLEAEVGKMKAEASEVVDKNTDIAKKHKAAKIEGTAVDVLESVRVAFQNVTENNNEMERLWLICKQCASKLVHFNNCVLKYENLGIPDKLKHLIRVECGELDLEQLFVALKALVDIGNLELPYLDSKHLENMTQQFTQLSKKYACLEEKVQTNTEVLESIAPFQTENLQIDTADTVIHSETTVVIDLEAASEEPLAVPLPDTP